MNPQLNRIEVWILEHSIRLFLAIAVAILLAAGAFLYLVDRQGSAEAQIEVLRPEVTKVFHAAILCEPRSLHHARESRSCARQLEIAFLNCRLYPSCRAILLAAVLTPGTPKEVMPQHPSSAGQHPSPGHAPGTRKPPAPTAAAAAPTPAPPTLPNGKPFPGVGPPGGPPGLRACVGTSCISVPLHPRP